MERQQQTLVQMRVDRAVVCTEGRATCNYAVTP